MSSSRLSHAQRNAVSELLRVFPVAEELGRRFARAGHELHLVGGSVRDALLGRLGDDLDFCTDAHPDQTLALLKGWARRPGRRAASSARSARTSGACGWRSRPSGGGLRRGDPPPVVHYGTTLQEDLWARDFTINAMAVSLPEHEFTDPFGGLSDLAARVLRTPGAPVLSFGDDPLRMLRAARFTAQLRFIVEPAVIKAMTEMAGDLARITAERIRDELSKLMLGADPVTGLRLLADTGPGRPVPARAGRARAGDR